ncbi:unnamed protein product [Moneuplotes crassus]|uniref:Actin, cytoplasmic n=1 Tax=Euplotes crassus TaxID=5936 RepID=A0AAD1Y9E8_EUPCR|nr:unnamed protein product [Moneuplotes crassus]
MSSEGSTPTPIVIDNGSGVVKAGLAGFNTPSAIFPSLIAYPKAVNVLSHGKKTDYYIGEEAEAKKGVCTIKYPIAHGIVSNWDEMKKIWDYTYYNELREEPSEHPVMLTEAPLNPKSNRENMTRIMFEEYDVPAMFIQIQAVLSLYSSGRTTGVVVDSGDGVTHTVPIFEGYQIPHAIDKILLAGRDLTEFMNRTLKDEGHFFETSSEKEEVRKMKEQTCYVAQNFEEDMKKASEGGELEENYVLPDRTICKYSVPRFKCPEMMFQPSLGGRDIEGVHQLTYNCIMNCDLDVRKDLYNNIILSGGTTMFPGFGERIYNEMKELAPKTMKIKVIASPDRKFAVWKGGSTLSLLSTFSGMWVTRADYDEFGESVIHRKCF